MAAVLAATPYRLSVTQYHQMGELGIVPEDARVELIEGKLIQMAPMGSWHSFVVRNHRLMRGTMGKCGR